MRQAHHTESGVPKVLGSVEEFRTVLSSNSAKLLWCYNSSYTSSNSSHHESGYERVIRACEECMKHGMENKKEEAMQEAATTGSRPSTVEVSHYVWNCTQFPDARRTLGMAPDAVVAVFAIHNQEFLDKLEGSEEIFGEQEEDGVVRAEEIKKRSSASDKVLLFCSKFVQYLNPQDQPEHPAGPSTMKIDIKKYMTMGQNLMAKGQPMYAEKFFAKAVGVLDALEDKTDDENIGGSIAMGLAWLSISQAVQGGSKVSAQDDAVRRIEQQFGSYPFVTEPRSDCQRAIGLRNLMRATPKSWENDSCSMKKLTEDLKRNPHDMTARVMMCVTLFMAGDMERFITEGLKLHVMGDEFGRVALDVSVAFLGKEDELIQKSGWLQLKESRGNS